MMTSVQDQMSRLDNGFTVVTDSVPHVGTVTAGVWLRAGSRDEAPDRNGISHFLEHLAFKGTSSKDAFAIVAEIENRGGSIDAYTDFETTAYYVQTGARHLDTAVALLAEVLTDSVFPEQEIEREIGVVLQEIDQYIDDPGAVLGDLLRAAIYPAQALGRPILGTPALVSGFTRPVLRDHVAQHYVPERMALVVSGCAAHAEVVALADRLFGRMAPASAPVPEPSRYVGGDSVQTKDIEQAHFALAFEGVPMGHPDLPALRHIANLLGGGMTSRLFQEIREKRGLAYDVHADLEIFADGGFIVFEAATEPGQCDDMASLLVREVERAATAGFTAEELARSKEQLRFAIALAGESTSSRAQRLARDALFRGAVRPIDTIEAEFDAVSLDSLNRVAAAVLSGRASRARVGPTQRKRRVRAVKA
ncbi:MAG: pitrilysin family protein [Rhodospirillaceae bacterium]